MKRTTIAAALSALAALATISFAPDSDAANYSLWVCGRNCAKTAGSYTDFGYWGSATTAAGVNKVAVNWDGNNSIATTNAAVRDALDCYCTGSNWCYIAAHSAGEMQVGYALDKYGASQRTKKNAGSCTNVDGTTQTGWNIKWVDVASGAGGGSELANMGEWSSSSPLVTDLKTGNARILYNHNNTQGKTFFMYAGASGTYYAGTLPGQDDEAVAYHSTLGVATTGSICNWSDYFCDNYAKLDAYGSFLWYKNSGHTLYSYRTVKYIDQSETYNHYTNGTWSGIVSPVRSHMAANAL
jgi:hypothetical protein